MVIDKAMIYSLWDEIDGNSDSKFYGDRDSALIGLHENYTRYWIENNKAKVIALDVVTYRLKEV